MADPWLTRGWPLPDPLAEPLIVTPGWPHSDPWLTPWWPLADHFLNIVFKCLITIYSYIGQNVVNNLIKLVTKYIIMVWRKAMVSHSVYSVRYVFKWSNSVQIWVEKGAEYFKIMFKKWSARGHQGVS